MKIGLHGGDCCGIKHIYNLGYYPSQMLAMRKPRKKTSIGQGGFPGTNDMMHKNRYGKEDFFNEAAPKESSEDRFKRFVAFIRKKRPSGIIEVVLNVHGKGWKPILEALNFKAVSEGLNSNTCCVITVYHLVYKFGN